MSEETGPTIYGDIRSGNCYKLKLLLELLGRPYRWEALDVLSGVTQSPNFLALNPNGKIPLLRLDDGRVLAESNAILHFLAEGSDFLPTERWDHAQVLQWLFFEQYSHEPYIAVARFIRSFLGLPEARRAEYESKQAGGYRALAVMDQHLARQEWLVGDGCSIADIALYAYTHVAHEGGFELAGYPSVRAWLDRIAALPGYVPMR
ncbi:MAG: glutathione S-transferase family protein [Xanthomonadales bacterium]|nr:glutathione S-transferase family protein [Xanthomonadales bacterium]